MTDEELLQSIFDAVRTAGGDGGAEAIREVREASGLPSDLTHNLAREVGIASERLAAVAISMGIANLQDAVRAAVAAGFENGIVVGARYGRERGR